MTEERREAEAEAKTEFQVASASSASSAPDTPMPPSSPPPLSRSPRPSHNALDPGGYNYQFVTYAPPGPPPRARSPRPMWRQASQAVGEGEWARGVAVEGGGQEGGAGGSLSPFHDNKHAITSGFVCKVSHFGVSRSHTHPSHTQNSRLLTSYLSLGVPVLRATQCM